VLLSSGANPDARDYYDNSALLLACETGSYNIAKLLVDSNASVEHNHPAGRGTAMHQVTTTSSFISVVEMCGNRFFVPNLFYFNDFIYV